MAMNYEFFFISLHIEINKTNRYETSFTYPNVLFRLE